MVETFKLDIGRFRIRETYDGLEIIDKDYENSYVMDDKSNVQEVVDIMNELDAFVKVLRRE